MDVILAMTRIAIRGQHDLGDILGNMASVTIEAAVHPRQRVAGLRVVIKAPPRPAIGIVAERAIRWAEATLMVLVAVAGGAIQRRALERRRAMAFLARHNGVATDQRKSRDVVIERHAAPIVLAVTSLATIAQLTVVPIVLTVTGYAGRPQLVAIEIAGMAGVALYLRMGASEWKFRPPIMVEANRAPLVVLMAGLALCTVSSTVDVLNLVTIDACSANSLIAFAAVTRRTCNVTMRAVERELGLVVVVRFDSTPCRLAVAVLAHFAKATLVRIIRLVAVEAASGRIAKLHGLHMTTAAYHSLMRVAQLEIRKCVIERFAIQVHDVGISPLVIGVTMSALLLRCIGLSSVESPTCQLICGDFLMACQA
jgi:hypothetical protein